MSNHSFNTNIDNLDDANLDDGNLDDLFTDEDELTHSPDQLETPKDRSTRPHEIGTTSSSSQSWVW